MVKSQSPSFFATNDVNRTIAELYMGPKTSDLCNAMCIAEHHLCSPHVGQKSFFNGGGVGRDVFVEGPCPWQVFIRPPVFYTPPPPPLGGYLQGWGGGLYMGFPVLCLLAYGDTALKS